MGSTFGPAYDPAKDEARIRKQHEAIRDFMLDGVWRTLAEIERDTGYPQASISAQLRHLRKPRFGSYVVDKDRLEGGGTWHYRVRPSGSTLHVSSVVVVDEPEPPTPINPWDNLNTAGQGPKLGRD